MYLARIRERVGGPFTRTAARRDIRPPAVLVKGPPTPFFRCAGIRPKWSVFRICRGHTTMDRTQDRQLIRRLQAGDETAVRELADRYGQRIYQLALRHIRNQQDAEEVTQDVLMKVCRKVDAFRGDAALSSWIYRITFNTAMSRLRGTRLARQADQERERLLTATEDGERPRMAQPADWSHMPDEELLRL